MSTSTTHTKKTRPSIPTLKTSHLLAQHKNHVTFDPYITTKQFRPPHKNEVNFDPRTKASPLRSPHHNRVNFNPRQKTKVISTPSLKSGQSRYIKSFSTVTQKPSQVRPLYWNEINFDHPHDNHINFIPTLNSSEVPSPTRNQVNFDHPSQLRCLQSNQVISGPHVKPRSISTTHTKKNKSILTPTYETSPFRSHTNTTSISIPTLKLSQLRPPPAQKPSTCRSSVLNRVNLDPHLKPIQVRSLHLYQVHSDPPHWNPVNFNHPHNHVNFDHPYKSRF